MTNTLITTFCCLLLAFTLNSCGKKGCMDKDSNNYDPEATKDDGSCTYDPANKYVGTYIATDTLIHLTGLDWSTNTATYETQYLQTGLVISKKDANAVSITNFGPCRETIDATVSTNNLIVQNPNSNCLSNGNLAGKIIYLNGNNLRYLLSYTNGSGSSTYKDTLKGIAIKQ